MAKSLLKQERKSYQYFPKTSLSHGHLGLVVIEAHQYCTDGNCTITVPSIAPRFLRLAGKDTNYWEQSGFCGTVRSGPVTRWATGFWILYYFMLVCYRQSNCAPPIVFGKRMYKSIFGIGLNTLLHPLAFCQVIFNSHVRYVRIIPQVLCTVIVTDVWTPG